jgi:hypothetical protein
MQNIVTKIHYKVTLYLCLNYKRILIKIFKTQNMLSNIKENRGEIEKLFEENKKEERKKIKKNKKML